jgi:hypothetical protein
LKRQFVQTIHSIIPLLYIADITLSASVKYLSLLGSIFFFSYEWQKYQMANKNEQSDYDNLIGNSASKKMKINLTPGRNKDAIPMGQG